jgi:hypothetical protein
MGMLTNPKLMDPFQIARITVQTSPKIPGNEPDFRIGGKRCIARKSATASPHPALGGKGSKNIFPTDTGTAGGPETFLDRLRTPQRLQKCFGKGFGRRNGAKSIFPVVAATAASLKMFLEGSPEGQGEPKCFWA